ncbi:MAG: hypothetical protein MI784_09265, partial [Cytophagales bacterium]|nr:hypothetical protein [Cytophagales bacterium]
AKLADRAVTREKVADGLFPEIGEKTKAEMETGTEYIFTALKGENSEIRYGAGVGQLSKFANPGLKGLLTDSAGWKGQLLTLKGDNAKGQLGCNSQEFRCGRRWYVCVSHTDSSATWERNTAVSLLDAEDDHDAAIIAELEQENAWNCNIKQLAAKSAKGDDYTSHTGYYYTCFTDDNFWRRVGEPATEDMYIRKTGAYTALCNALEAHDFAAEDYNASALSEKDRKGMQGQRYYADRKLYECVQNDAHGTIWTKIKG